MPEVVTALNDPASPQTLAFQQIAFSQVSEGRDPWRGKKRGGKWGIYELLEEGFPLSSKRHEVNLCH